MESGPVGSRVTVAEGGDAVERRGLGGVGTSYDRVRADRESDVGRKVRTGRIGNGFPLQKDPNNDTTGPTTAWRAQC